MVLVCVLCCGIYQPLHVAVLPRACNCVQTSVLCQHLTLSSPTILLYFWHTVYQSGSLSSILKSKPNSQQQFAHPFFQTCVCGMNKQKNVGLQQVNIMWHSTVCNWYKEKCVDIDRTFTMPQVLLQHNLYATAYMWRPEHCCIYSLFA